MTFLAENAKIISLLFFFSVFLFIAWRAYRPGAKQELQQHAFIPLKEENKKKKKRKRRTFGFRNYWPRMVWAEAT